MVDTVMLLRAPLYRLWRDVDSVMKTIRCQTDESSVAVAEEVSARSYDS